jgi:PncC family amidohydrolase
MEALLAEIAAALTARRRTLATAESCTGGMVGAALTSIPGSSNWFLGGIIAYANSVKSRALGVRADMLRNHGAVSPETARAMAGGVRTATGADYGLALTGIAGPAGGSPEKPVGLVYLAIAGPEGTSVFEHRFAGGRAEIRNAAVMAALQHLRTTVAP